MTAKTLRDLAREHSKGNLSLEAYRKARAELVEAILAGNIAVKDVEFRAPLDPVSNDDNQDATVPRGQKKKTRTEPDPSQTSIVPDRVRPTPKAPPPVSRRGGRFWLAGVLVAVVVAAAGAIYVVVSREHARPSPAAQAQVPKAAAPSEDNAATQLIGAFIAHNNWSDEELDKFVSQWSALPDPVRTAASGSMAEEQLATEVYKQLLEERALSGLGESTQAGAREQKLVDFAHRVGLKDPRLVVKPAAAGTSPEPSAGSSNP